LRQIHTTEEKEPGRYNLNEVPPYYSSPDHEFDSAVKDVVVVDRSFFERIEVKGRDKLDLLHRLSTNDVRSLEPGHATSTVFTTEKGRVVDYVYVIALESLLLLITSPQYHDVFVKWIDKYTISEDIMLSATKQQTSMLSLIGPNAIAFAKTVFGVGLQVNQVVTVPGVSGMNAVVLRQEFGTTIVDCVFNVAQASTVWQEFSRIGVTMMGFNAYEAFRISRGIPSIGKEISESFNPFEVGLLHAINFTKGCYIGQEVIARLNTYQKVQRQLVGLVFTRPLPSVDLPVSLKNESGEVGWLTSISESAIHGKIMALGVIRNEAATVGQSLWHGEGKDAVQGVISNLPIL
jgi:tRNA-modifying protein YgfZ